MIYQCYILFYIYFRPNISHSPTQSYPKNVLKPVSSTLPINESVSNLPWRKTPSSSNTINNIRPSYSSAISGANFNITTLNSKILPDKKLNAAPIPVSKGPSVSPKEEWSSSVKAYVERSFLSCKTPAQRDIMEQLLRVKIKESIASDRMNTINWASEPIPKHFDSTKSKQASQNPIIISNDSMKKSFVHNNPVVSFDERKKMDRAKRFEADQRAFKNQQAQNQLALQNVRIEDNQGDVIDWDEYTIVGTCQKLEKPYLRLTSAPDPATVRPLPVLKQTLKLLKDKWRNGIDYGFICDQFKSLRQDMTVQRIKSDFTVQVYEIHARIAIEQGDLGQYNQCQTQLKDLYSIGLSGSESEFLAYRLLYLIHCRNWQSINQFIGSLSSEQKNSPPVNHALNVRSATSLGNYAQLFQLYTNAPNMGAYLMDLFISRERITAFNTMIRAYRPTLSLSFICETLGFNSMDDCKAWLQKELGEFQMSNSKIDCKFYLSKLISK